MSNIPSSAMPHAGGQSNTTDTNSGSSSSGQFSSGQGATTTGGTGASGQFSSGQSTSTTGQSGTSQYQPSQSQQSQYQPSQNFSGSASSYEGRETIQSSRRRDTVMDKARDNKTGIAIGVVGAAAVAAIPFLLSKRNKSKEQYRDFPVSVDNRTQASDSYSANDRFSGNDRGTKNNY